MIVRINILPKCLSDACVTAFIFTMIPAVYYFELFIVLPQYYTVGSFWYCFHFITGTFILFNVCSNLLAVMICDTSIRGRMLPPTMGPNWKLCAVCECISPPRSFHCDICNVCILKRDHHCMFTGCCIGHHNQRYFLVFVFYIFVATTYASYYNFYFGLDYLELNTWKSIFKLLLPLVALVFEQSIGQIYIFMVLIIFIGCLFTGFLFFYHIKLILTGYTTYEKNHKINPYDQGKKLNLLGVLGTQWHLIWLSPLIESTPIHDGINWETKESAKAK